MSPVANRRGPVLLLVGVLLLSGCVTSGDDGADRPDPGQSAGPDSAQKDGGGASAAPQPTPTADPATLEPADVSETKGPRRANATIERVPAGQWDRIVDAGVWRPGCPVSRRELRRVEVNHYTFAGKIRRGVLVVNRDVAASVVRIFTTLFEERFPIRQMRPVEVYGGDSHRSLRADNTSAYNCRRLTQINAPPMKSPHANGRAIDINPRENPWKDLRCDCWFPNRRNRARTPGPGVIVKGGLVWRTFRDEGWIWQNIDVPDYMHFDTGYPSKPYRGPEAAKRSRARKADSHS